MEIEDFYKIFADMEEAQETRLKQFKADLMETIAESKAEQKKDLGTICKNQDVLNKQMESLNTAKNATNSPELTKVLNAIHLDLNRLEQARNTPTFHFWCVVVLIMALFGIVEYQIYQLPEQTAEQLYQTYYANQPKTTTHTKNR